MHRPEDHTTVTRIRSPGSPPVELRDAAFRNQMVLHDMSVPVVACVIAVARGTSSAAELAELEGISPTAASNRLTRAEGFELIVFSHRDGREKKYRLSGFGATMPWATESADTRSAVGYAVRQRREAVGMSLDDLVRKSGLSRAALWKLETVDRPNPTLETLSAVAIALSCSVAELVS